jgi:hypothetical protein
VHWLDLGETDIDNLVLLCRHHHRLVHEDGWTLLGNPGGDLSFHRPDGINLPAAPAVTPGSAEPVQAHHRSDTDGRCQWTGEPLDLHYAISVYFDAEELRRRHHHEPITTHTP